VLTPFTLSELQSNIQKAEYTVVMTNASNYDDTKMFPVLLRLFSPSKWVQVKVLELKSLPREKVETLNEFLINYLSSVNARVKNYLYL
jgi:hypothetical protein